MADTLTHDVLILCSGWKGLRAAIEIARVREKHTNIGVVSKQQIARPPSDCADGDTAAVLQS